ncbi:Nucleolar protein NOP2 [Spironucleus salmonicida]|uniref:Nucleolar protein NOP2 n=1 Tax=Spironucleus salmonicida TaxID=348837 RepID=V6LX74_9EUKA|nr:Nucleolar protein NOP2 [Spironucleus salmonicida]|eukprot:EST48848.1 Nucleolar protein NOP2 [Spironucleus salmonicida]
MSLVSLSSKAQMVDNEPIEEQFCNEEENYEIEEVQNQPRNLLELSDSVSIDEELLAHRKLLIEQNIPEPAPAPQNTQYDPRSDLPNSPEQTLARLSRVSYILSNFKNERNPQVPRPTYVQILKQDVINLYGYSDDVAEILLGVFGPVEFLSFVQASEKPRPLTIRVNPLKAKRRDVAAALLSRGVELEPITWSPDGLTVFSSQIPLGATPEYLKGLYMIQDAASMMPVLALRPQANEKIIDISAAPGGKTTHIASLMKNTGVLIANDFNRLRIDALQANLARMGVTNTIVVNYDGRKLPYGGMDRVLLDAPCTGLGVICKDPKAKCSRNFQDLDRQQALQRELLWHAIDMVSNKSNSPRMIVYSTCSVTIAENEAVVDWVLQKRGDCQIVETGLVSGNPGIGNYRGKKFFYGMEKSRRFYPHTHNVQGFYVCCIQRKPGMKPLVEKFNQVAGKDE